MRRKASSELARRPGTAKRSPATTGSPGRKDLTAPFMGKPVLPTHLKQVSLDDIDLNDQTFQFRLELKSGDLRQSIEREGQKFPVVLRRDKPPYQLVCGFRRIEALKESGSPTAMALVLPGLSEDEAYRLSILENRERAPLSELDMANAVAKLRTRGRRQGEIAGFLGRSVRQIQRYLEVTRFPAELKTAMASGRISLGHGLILNRALVEGAHVDLKHWIRKIQDRKLSVPALKRHLAEALGRYRRVQYFRRRGNGFRMAAFEFDPRKATPRERREMVKALKRALVILKKRK